MKPAIRFPPRVLVAALALVRFRSAPLHLAALHDSALLLAAFLSPGIALSNGTIVAWGDNSWGQCDVPAPNDDFVAVAAGASHSLGVTAGGAIVAWGRNDHGECNVPAPNEGFVAAAGGERHSLGLRADGSIVAWGDNAHGQCSVPEPNFGFTAIAAGGCHSLGLKADGTVVAWGANSYGQINVPPPNEGFTAVGSGYNTSAGITTGGTIRVWGYTGRGEAYVPAPNSGYLSVSGRSGHLLALRSDGSIAAWAGNNDYDECTVPPPNSGFLAVAAGNTYSMGCREDGSIRVWGRCDGGLCDVPEHNMDFVSVASGFEHGLGLKYWTGACCQLGGDCWVSTPSRCGGAWRGEGTTCDPDPCESLVWSNAGGTLVVHDTGIAYTHELTPPPSTPPPVCTEVINQIPLGTSRVWKVYAVFPLGTQPRLKALSWGVYPSTNGGGAVVIEGHGLPDPAGDVEYVPSTWPWEWGCGIYEVFATPKLTRVTECYWFGGYGYAGTSGEPQIFALGPSAVYGSEFFDDAVPSTQEPIAAFGSIGFGQPGATACPDDPAWGACCLPDGACTLTLEADCDPPADWKGATVPCAPNPCGQSSAGDPLPTGVLHVRTAPTPFAGSVSLWISGPQTDAARLSIFDAGGRLVRVAWNGKLPAKEIAVTWNGRDAAEREMPAGIYWAQVETLSGSVTARMVKAR